MQEKVTDQFCAVLQEQVTVYLFNKYRRSTLNRVDIVFDIYLDHNIKNLTRNKRGFGKNIKVSGDTLIPRHWRSFLYVNKNKTQLSQLLAAELIQQTNFKQLAATKDTVIVTNIANYLPSQLTLCNHEDTVVLVHTVDMDVVVIAISFILLYLRWKQS